MGSSAHGFEAHKRLTRETRVPLVTAQRPCILVALSLATVMAFASLDAMLWSQHAQQEVIRNHTDALQGELTEVTIELDRTRAINALLEAERRQLLREITQVRHELCVRDRQCQPALLPPSFDALFSH